MVLQQLLVVAVDIRLDLREHVDAFVSAVYLALDVGRHGLGNLQALLRQNSVFVGNPFYLQAHLHATHIGRG